MQNERILVITTGGTIDAIYDPAAGTPHVVPFPPGGPEKTAVPAAMARLRIDGACDFHRYSMKDSKYLTTQDFDAILDEVRRGDYQRILLVTGTDRMPEIGQYIETKIAEEGVEGALAGRHFVLTGAMGPLRDAQERWRLPDEHAIDKNDGWYNLRRAVHDLERGPPGVHLRMRDDFWPASRVTKDVAVDQAGPTAMVTQSGFRALVHPESRGPKISH